MLLTTKPSLPHYLPPEVTQIRKKKKKKKGVTYAYLKYIYVLGIKKGLTSVASQVVLFVFLKFLFYL